MPSEVHARDYAWPPVAATFLSNFQSCIYTGTGMCVRFVTSAQEVYLIYSNLFCMSRTELVYTIFGAFVVLKFYFATQVYYFF